MSLTSIPYLEEEALVAIFDEEDARDMEHPLLRFFPRQGYRGGRIKVRRRSRKPGELRHTSMDGQAHPVARATMAEQDYEPSFIKVFAQITQADIALFQAADQERSERRGSSGAIQDEANAQILSLAQDLREDTVEERHRLCAEALQGSISYRLGDMTTDLTVSYGLTSLTDPGTDWTNAGATIVSDVLGWFEAFKDGNTRGRSCNTAFYNPKLYNDAFLANTQWLAWKQANEELAKGFLGIAGGMREADFYGRIKNVFGINWVPVEGTYRDLGGTNVERWAVDKITFANVDPVMFQEPSTPEIKGRQRQASAFEWGMAKTTYNPDSDLAFRFEGPKRADVDTWSVYCFDNGLPVLRNPDLVRPADVVNA